MTQTFNRLSENVYVLKEQPPIKDDADAKGNVLYFKPGFGWYSGYWHSAHMDGTTHWTFLPERPPELEDTKVKREKAYQAWMKLFPAEFDPAADALIRLGFNAGWERAN